MFCYSYFSPLKYLRPAPTVFLKKQVLYKISAPEDNCPKLVLKVCEKHFSRNSFLIESHTYNLQFYLKISPFTNIFNSSCSQAFFKICVFKNFPNFTGKHRCWRLFLLKLQSQTLATLLKRDSITGVFLRNQRNFQEQLFLQNTFGDCFIFQVFWAKELSTILNKSPNCFLLFLID